MVPTASHAQAPLPTHTVHTESSRRHHTCQQILACGLDMHAHHETKGTTHATSTANEAVVRFRHDIDCQATLAHMTHMLRHGDTLFHDTPLSKHTLRGTRALSRTLGAPIPMGTEGPTENRAASPLLMLAQQPRMPASLGIMPLLLPTNVVDDGHQLVPAIETRLLPPVLVAQDVVTDRDGLQLVLVAPFAVRVQKCESNALGPLAVAFP